MSQKDSVYVALPETTDPKRESEADQLPNRSCIRMFCNPREWCHCSWLRTPITELLWVFLWFGVILLYQLIGASIFHNLESDHEAGVIAELHRTNQALCAMMDNSNNSVGYAQLAAQENKLISTEVKQFMALTSVNWNYPGSALFSMTLFTTVGYGHCKHARWYL
eukprot:TRINITY_DN9303_c0_g1_i4.p1 TRINITY_DN9303_c0_g1~~TRINITY_DN9303_c0_g1_i4.p1  ORF type:complete len:165 (-),score=28.79 TRINITY_DN9303_c0_g1_i4:795-1289(-)